MDTPPPAQAHVETIPVTQSAPPQSRLPPENEVFLPLRSDDGEISPQKTVPKPPLRKLVTSRSVPNLLNNAPDKQRAPMSLLGFLGGELTRGYLDREEIGRNDAKDPERIYEFLRIPWEVEKLFLFGFVICLDSFLFLFTLLPMRVLVALCKVPTRMAGCTKFTANQVCDLLRMIVGAGCCYGLYLIDMSRMYHIVRGQDVIKLYVIYNVLETLEKLCCSFGQDIFDALFSNAVDTRRYGLDSQRSFLRSFLDLVITLIYSYLHSVVLFFEVIALTVAVNSYNNALITLLVSNQFMELKGSLFKKFAKENLFQMTCSDMVERFRLVLFLFVIMLQNSPHGGLVGYMHYIFFAIIGSEAFVDYVKHVFITKFNKIDVSIYPTFKRILCKDIVVHRLSQASKDIHAVSHRLGFVPLPLACVLIRVTAPFLPALSFKWALVGVLCWCNLLVLKFLIGLVLLGYSLDHKSGPSDTTILDAIEAFSDLPGKSS